MLKASKNGFQPHRIQNIFTSRKLQKINFRKRASECWCSWNIAMTLVCWFGRSSSLAALPSLHSLCWWYRVYRSQVRSIKKYIKNALANFPRLSIHTRISYNINIQPRMWGEEIYTQTTATSTHSGRERERRADQKRMTSYEKWILRSDSDTEQI